MRREGRNVREFETARQTQCRLPAVQAQRRACDAEGVGKGAGPPAQAAEISRRDVLLPALPGQSARVQTIVAALRGAHARKRLLPALATRDLQLPGLLLSIVRRVRSRAALRDQSR